MACDKKKWWQNQGEIFSSSPDVNPSKIALFGNLKRWFVQQINKWFYHSRHLDCFTKWKGFFYFYLLFSSQITRFYPWIVINTVIRRTMSLGKHTFLWSGIDYHSFTGGTQSKIGSSPIIFVVRLEGARSQTPNNFSTFLYWWSKKKTKNSRT